MNPTSAPERYVLSKDRAKYDKISLTYAHPSLLGLESGLWETLDRGTAVRLQVYTDEIQKL